MKLFLGLAGGITLGSAATIVLTDPLAMQAVEGALQTMDPEAGVRAAQAVAGVTSEAWPLLAAIWVITLTWKFGEPIGNALGVWLTHLAERHHAREIKRQKLAAFMWTPNAQPASIVEEQRRHAPPTDKPFVLGEPSA
jgi:hypothetical protein